MGMDVILEPDLLTNPQSLFEQVQFTTHGCV